MSPKLFKSEIIGQMLKQFCPIGVELRTMPRYMYTLLILAQLTVAGSELNTCQSASKHFYKKYSTKTPYQYIVDDLGKVFII